MVAFIAMRLLHKPNLMSLGGITSPSALAIDAAIVMIENARQAPRTFARWPHTTADRPRRCSPPAAR